MDLSLLRNTNNITYKGTEGELSGMGAEDVGARRDPQQQWQEICFRLGAPGNDVELPRNSSVRSRNREEVNRVLEKVTKMTGDRDLADRARSYLSDR